MFRTTSLGFTKEQLYSTASYQAQDLHGVNLENNELFFVGRMVGDDDWTYGLFRTDGVRAALIGESWIGQNTAPHHLIAAGDSVYFMAGDSDAAHLYVFDGEATHELDAPVDPFGRTVGTWQTIGNTLYFIADDSLFSANGTDVTQLTFGEIELPAPSRRYGFGELGNQMFFWGIENRGPELFVVEEGSVRRFAENPFFPRGNPNYGPATFVEVNGELYFGAERDGRSDWALYRTDGITFHEVGTPGPAGHVAGGRQLKRAVAFGDGLVFLDLTTEGYMLYSASEMDVVPLTDAALKPAGGLYDNDITVVGDSVFFNVGRTLYSYDGDVVEELSPCCSRQAGEAILNRGGEILGVLGSTLFFQGDGPAGAELYKTDGKTVELVADIYEAAESSPGGLFGFREFGEHLFFDVEEPIGGDLIRRRLFHTDGEMVEFVAGVELSGEAPLLTAGDRMYFVDRDLGLVSLSIVPEPSGCLLLILGLLTVLLLNHRTYRSV